MRVVPTHGVAVVLRARAVGDDEDLDELEEPRARPETLALVALDLVERLAQAHAAPLELYVHERKAVHEDRHVVAVLVRALVRLVLVHHLEAVPVDMVPVQEVDVLIRAVIALEGYDRVVLDAPRLVDDRKRRVRDVLRAEAPPLGVGELDAVQLLELGAQVGDELGLGVDAEPVVALVREDVDEAGLEVCLRLVGALGRRRGGRLGADRRLGSLQDEAVGRQAGGGVLGDGVVDGHDVMPPPCAGSSGACRDSTRTADVAPRSRPEGRR